MLYEGGGPVVTEAPYMGTKLEDRKERLRTIKGLVEGFKKRGTETEETNPNFVDLDSEIVNLYIHYTRDVFTNLINRKDDLDENEGHCGEYVNEINLFQEC